MDSVRIDHAVNYYDPVDVGYKLKAVASHVEQTTIRAGYRIEDEKFLQITKLRMLADQLIAGRKIETREINRVLLKLNQEIEKLDQEVRHQRSQATSIPRWMGEQWRYNEI